MNCDTYCILIPSKSGDVIVAKGMDLNMAIILLKALMIEFYNEPSLEYAIRREERRSDG